MFFLGPISLGIGGSKQYKHSCQQVGAAQLGRHPQSFQLLNGGPSLTFPVLQIGHVNGCLCKATEFLAVSNTLQDETWMSIKADPF